jgi:hypothetical protein
MWCWRMWRSPRQCLMRSCWLWTRRWSGWERRRRLLAEIVGLRFFVGLSWPEIAEMTGVPERELNRQWAFARAWLRTELT